MRALTDAVVDRDEVKRETVVVLVAVRELLWECDTECVTVPREILGVDDGVPCVAVCDIDSVNEELIDGVGVGGGVNVEDCVRDRLPVGVGVGGGVIVELFVADSEVLLEGD